MRGSCARRVVLYARVSTGEQARNGYSLAQQIEALRTHAARTGDEILEEVTDPGESGAQLVRPGMDRVRDLVAVGGVSAVLAQDADRLSREPEHLLLLSREFGGRGCRLEVLGDGAADDGRLAAYERAKLTERSRRGKLRKAREGKVVGATKPNFGFRFNEARDGYRVYEEEMRVVRRIFRMVGEEGQALNAVKRALEAEGVPTPSGKRRWLTHVIRGFVLNDVYRPHPFGEVSGMVAPEVAAGLDPDACYGVWWFNRERWTRRRVAEASGEGRAYRWSVNGALKPKEEWIAAGCSRLRGLLRSGSARPFLKRNHVFTPHHNLAAAFLRLQLLFPDPSKEGHDGLVQLARCLRYCKVPGRHLPTLGFAREAASRPLGQALSRVVGFLVGRLRLVALHEHTPDGIVDQLSRGHPPPNLSHRRTEASRRLRDQAQFFFCSRAFLRGGVRLSGPTIGRR
ncbi:MAG: recombinase family protein [Actinomycetota bacterium]|nr:recombinase family protein [Actinomycetota bacterium]